MNTPREESIKQFRKKINELTDTLLDTSESLWIHMLINITLVDDGNFMRNMWATKWMKPTDIAYACLGQSANTFSCITQPQNDKDWEQWGDIFSEPDIWDILR